MNFAVFWIGESMTRTIYVAIRQGTYAPDPDHSAPAVQIMGVGVDLIKLREWASAQPEPEHWGANAISVEGVMFDDPLLDVEA